MNHNYYYEIKIDNWNKKIDKQNINSKTVNFIIKYAF